jgi:DNA-binding LacI/PurR family transcriptional regulator/DNA-binding transcriptional regulator YhcF (GntR family)
MKKRRPGIEKAVEFLAGYGTSHPSGGKMPPIRTLARHAGVSFVTMWKAVRTVKESGGNKIHQPAQTQNISPETALSLQPANLLWRKVQLRLKKDILIGRFVHNDYLPPFKELQYQYSVSFRTLKKAINELSNEGIIKPGRKGYIVPAFTTTDSNAKVVALGCGWEDGKIWADYQDRNYFRILESECMLKKISLDNVVYFRQNNHLRFIHSAARQPYSLTNSNILGVIYIIANLEVDPGDVLKELAVIKKPVAILDVVGYFNNHVFPFGNRFVRLFTTTASFSPARLAAQYLLRLGHKHIAFISPFHKAQWSKMRYTACAAMYNDAGYPGGVTPFVLDRFAYQWDYIKKPGSREDLQTLISQYAQWKKHAHAEFFKKFGNISYSISKYLTEWNCASGEIYQKMVPFFQKALRDPRITAWCMANDFAATQALDFLKEHGIHIPRDLSILSFDNTIDAMEYQLSTYDFNNNGIVNMMLRYILSPSTIPAQDRGKIIEVDGTIVVRRSTGPARTT